MTLKYLCENKLYPHLLTILVEFVKSIKSSSKTEEVYKTIAWILDVGRLDSSRKDNEYGEYDACYTFTLTFFKHINKNDPEYEKFDSILRETFGEGLPEGKIIGYKKAVGHFGLFLQPCIVKLKIPEDALRSKGLSTKCRCSKAYVEEIYALLDHNWKATKAHSSYDNDFNYISGQMVEVDDFDTCPWIECSSGIHFFENEQDAMKYRL